MSFRKHHMFSRALLEYSRGLLEPGPGVVAGPSSFRYLG